MGCGTNATVHFRKNVDSPKGVEPLCNDSSKLYFGRDSLGYMTTRIEDVTCLACRLLIVHYEYTFEDLQKIREQG